jgi:hypothetical protein
MPGEKRAAMPPIASFMIFHIAATAGIVLLLQVDWRIVVGVFLILFSERVYDGWRF